MRERIGKIDRAVDRFMYWRELVLLVMSIPLAGLWSQVPFLHDLGWASYVLIGLFSAAILLLLLTAIAALWRWSKRGQESPPVDFDGDKKESKSRQLSEREEQALDDLTHFVSKHLIDSVYHLWRVQCAILALSSNDEHLTEFAAAGLWHKNSSIETLYKSFSELSELGGSPARTFEFNEMMMHVDRVERNYESFRKQLDAICKHVGINAVSRSEVRPVWNEWREQHNAMIAAYDEIKADRRFTILFRPRRPARWGGPVEAPNYLAEWSESQERS